MKVSNPNEVHTFNNRYNSRFTFTKINSKTILWEGEFTFCRMGYPNDYTEAYNEYLKQGPPHDHSLSMDEFKDAVHEYDYDLGDYNPIAKKYGGLVKSKKDVINMIDPSGGPYLTSGTNMNQFGFKGKNIIKEFKCGVNPDGVLIILE